MTWRSCQVFEVFKRHLEAAAADTGKLPAFRRGASLWEASQKALSITTGDLSQKLRYLDIGQKFLDADKSTLSKDIMPDLLHPSANGYQIWANEVMPTITAMMRGK